MKNSFVIKSFQNGISLILDPEVPFDILKSDIAEKFNASRSFFGSASIALSLEGRSLTPGQEVELIDIINENSDLEVICIAEKSSADNVNFVKAMQTLQNKMSFGAYCKVQNGSLRDHAVLETEDSILILGDVDPSCAVRASKNIIVLGSLLGEAYAGKNTEEVSYIIALEMQPESLGIGSFKYKPAKRSIWKKKSKIQPKIAMIQKDEVVILPLTKDILESL